MRNKSNLVLLFIAIILGAVAAFMARSFIQGQSQSATQTSRTIVVAATSIDVGVVMTENYIAEIPWHSASLPEGAFVSKEEFFQNGARVLR